LSITGYFSDIRKEIDKQVNDKIAADKKITDIAVKDIVEKTIRKHHDVWGKAAKLSHVTADYEKTLLGKYGGIIAKAKSDIFQQLPISDKIFGEIQAICASIFSRDRFARNTSGLVVAGFGEAEVFPAVISYNVEAKINGTLKYKQEQDAAINYHNTAWILPFAQSEMVATFIEGVDPAYNKLISDYLSEYFDQYPDFIVGSIENADETKKQEFAKKLKEIGRTIIADFDKKLQAYRSANHVNPIINAVSFLPKDELAGMAESLVNLTSFKRKISLDAETVGGPIDVAVISKGDGFIWIKRKHYFKPELNTGFFTNYYRDYSEGHDHEKD